MDSLIHLSSVLPAEQAAMLRKKAENELELIYRDYFSDKSFADFQSAHLGHESLVMKLLAYRFVTMDMMSDLKSRLTESVKQIFGETDLLFHPVFYMRFSFPGIYYSDKHRTAFLDSQPHYDISYNLRAFSFWLALDDIDEDSGGLCAFQGKDIEEHFKISEEGKNRYNYNGYLEAASVLDPMLKRGIIAPAVKPGDVLTFDSTLLHGATKPRARRRVSFDFRLVPKKYVISAAGPVRKMFEEINKGYDLCNAKNLMILGDFIGCSRILRSLGAAKNNSELIDLADALQFRAPDKEILQPGARMAWKNEYKWLSSNQSAY